MDDLNGENEERTANASVRCPPNCRRPVDKGDPAMPEALHCSRAVSTDLSRLGGGRSV